MGKGCQALPHTYSVGSKAGFIALRRVGGHRLLPGLRFVKFGNVAMTFAISRLLIVALLALGAAACQSEDLPPQ